MGALAEFFDEYTQVLGIRSRKSGGTIFIEIVLEFENGRPKKMVADRLGVQVKSGQSWTGQSRPFPEPGGARDWSEVYLAACC